MIRRGEVLVAELDPVVGREQGKARPVVVVSNDAANGAAVERSGVITVVPVTSNLARVHDFQVRVEAGASGLNRNSKAQCEQVRSISVERVVQSLGFVPAEVLAEIDEALLLHLGL